MFGETCKCSFEKLQKKYGKDCMSCRQVYELSFKWFKDLCESVESAEWTERLLTN